MDGVAANRVEDRALIDDLDAIANVVGDQVAWQSVATDDVRLGATIKLNSSLSVSKAADSVYVGANEVIGNQIPLRVDTPNADSQRTVTGNHVSCRFIGETILGNADSVRLCAVDDFQADEAVSKCGGSIRGDSDEVPNNDVVVRTGSGDQHAGISVTRDDVPFDGIRDAVGIRSDQVARRVGTLNRHDRDHNAPLIAKSQLSGYIGSDIVAGNDVVCSAKPNRDAIIGVAGDNVSFGRVEVISDFVVTSIGSDSVSRATMDLNSILTIAKSDRSRDVRAHEIAGHDGVICLVEHDTVVVVAGNDVSLSGICDAISIRTDPVGCWPTVLVISPENYTVVAGRTGITIPQRTVARGIHADEVAGDDVVV